MRDEIFAIMKRQNTKKGNYSYVQKRQRESTTVPSVIDHNMEG